MSANRVRPATASLGWSQEQLVALSRVTHRTLIIYAASEGTTQARMVYGTTARPIEQRIELAWTRPHFGGRRWWFVCPMTGVLAGRLHCTGQRVAFACLVSRI